MFKNIFIDANVILDFLDNTRLFHDYSKNAYAFLLQNNYNLFTSCDLITTIYYVNSKKDKKQAVLNIQAINKTLKIIEFSNKEVEEACSLILQDDEFKDLEDTIQYIIAKKYKCDLIISNDKNFVNKDTLILSSEKFLQTVLKI